MLRGPPPAGYDAVTERDYNAALPPEDIRELQGFVAATLSSSWSWPLRVSRLLSAIGMVFPGFGPNPNNFIDPTLVQLAKTKVMSFVQSEQVEANPRLACLHEIGLVYGKFHQELIQLTQYIQQRNNDIEPVWGSHWAYETITPTFTEIGVPKSIII